MKSQIVFSETVWKKLEEIKTENAALLYGWERNQSLYCVGSAKLPNNWDSLGDVGNTILKVFEHLSCGLKIIGLHRTSDEEAVRNNCKSYLDSLISPPVLEEYLIDPLLVYVWKKLDGETTTFLYDTESEMISDSKVEVCSLDLHSELVFMRVKSSLDICFDLDDDFETTRSNILNAVSNLKKKVASSSCAFHLEKSTLLLHNSPDQVFHGPVTSFNSDSQCCLLSSYLNEDKDLKNRDVNLNLKMLFLLTGKQDPNQIVSCVPVIRYERRIFKAVSIPVSIDMMATIPMTLPLSKLPIILGQGVSCQLNAVGHSIIKFYKKLQILTSPEIYHFPVQLCDHYITVCYPKDISENELEPLRREIHELFALPMEKPLIRRSMKYSPESSKTDIYLKNVHIGLRSPGVEGGIKALVHGTYSYHHYMQDNINDDGWGCAYRSLQTVISWFKHQGYTDAPIPSHVDIQKTLVALGDKPATFINSRQWIGSMEVGFCLESLLGIQSKYIIVNSGSELAFKGRELVNHFNTQGTPIMIGGGVLAHTILGVDVNFDTGNIKFLVLDPHYTGGEELVTIQKKGWCGWKSIEFWNKTAYYNLCCPQRPQGI